MIIAITMIFLKNDSLISVTDVTQTGLDTTPSAHCMGARKFVENSPFPGLDRRLVDQGHKVS